MAFFLWLELRCLFGFGVEPLGGIEPVDGVDDHVDGFDDLLGVAWPGSWADWR